MKNVLKFAVAASSIAALLACGGIASAQAESVSLCKANEAICLAANQYPKETVLEFGNPSSPMASLKLKAVGEVTCDTQITGDSTAATAEPTLPGEVSGTNWAFCSLAKEACTVTSVNLPYRLAISKGAGGNGTFTITPRPGGGNPGMSVVCGALVNCTYTVAKLELPFVGGAKGVANLKATAIAMAGAGKACPTATFTAQWNSEAPANPLFVSS